MPANIEKLARVLQLSLAATSVLLILVKPLFPQATAATGIVVGRSIPEP